MVYSVSWSAEVRRTLIRKFQTVFSSIAPYLLMGVIGLLGAVAGPFLPETTGASLPDSPEDVEEFGK